MSKGITDIPELDMSQSFMMGLAYKQFRTLANQQLVTEFDITLEMLGALRVLAHLGEVPQQTLCDRLHRERSVIKRLVDNCIKRELVAAHKSEQNKKARYLTLTDKGRAVEAGAHKCVAAVVDEFYAPLSAEERQLLLSLCKRLIKEDVLLGAD